MPYFEVVAHRGVPIEAPENTIPSFQRAIDIGADAIEFDVRLTRDRVPIIHHYTQLSSEVVSTIRSWGIEVHAWDVNDEQSLNSAMELGIPRICTDKLQRALDFRQRRSRWTMAET
jgi:glycerophosphoryl diester phosphodiesterase